MGFRLITLVSTPVASRAKHLRCSSYSGTREGRKANSSRQEPHTNVNYGQRTSPTHNLQPALLQSASSKNTHPRFAKESPSARTDSFINGVLTQLTRTRYVSGNNLVSHNDVRLFRKQASWEWTIIVRFTYCGSYRRLALLTLSFDVALFGPPSQQPPSLFRSRSSPAVPPGPEERDLPVARP